MVGATARLLMVPAHASTWQVFDATTAPHRQQHGMTVCTCMDEHDDSEHYDDKYDDDEHNDNKHNDDKHNDDKHNNEGDVDGNGNGDDDWD